jgi:ABC-type branched-subunit amino acid transport system ATPase component
MIFEGADLLKRPADQRRNSASAMGHQGREIFPYLTVEENLRVGPWAFARAAPLHSRSAAVRKVRRGADAPVTMSGDVPGHRFSGQTFI